jgi:hypothetical protein
MAGLKDLYTKIFLEQLGLPCDEDSVKKQIPLWWKNTRKKLDSGLALTPLGFKVLTEDLDLLHYEIKFPKDFEFSTKIVLFLDQFIDCPHYYTKKEIVVFKEKKACELMIFSGDIRKYGTAKALAKQRELDKAG